MGSHVLDEVAEMVVREAGDDLPGFVKKMERLEASRRGEMDRIITVAMELNAPAIKLAMLDTPDEIDAAREAMSDDEFRWLVWQLAKVTAGLGFFEMIRHGRGLAEAMLEDKG